MPHRTPKTVSFSKRDTITPIPHHKHPKTTISDPKAQRAQLKKEILKLEHEFLKTRKSREANELKYEKSHNMKCSIMFTLSERKKMSKPSKKPRFPEESPSVAIAQTEELQPKDGRTESVSSYPRMSTPAAPTTQGNHPIWNEAGCPICAREIGRLYRHIRNVHHYEVEPNHSGQYRITGFRDPGGSRSQRSNSSTQPAASNSVPQFASIAPVGQSADDGAPLQAHYNNTPALPPATASLELQNDAPAPSTLTPSAISNPFPYGPPGSYGAADEWLANVLTEDNRNHDRQARLAEQERQQQTMPIPSIQINGVEFVLQTWPDGPTPGQKPRILE
ncbi:hypothetical protein CBER1_01446 [Cercospora berteroae]|uniref:Uncharacterized protein n=1 Tax=Cercospora berteroae TaxID=357750 RepID=A0A2S6C5Q0_9PEZI|nr:hypothetical protein CBER1_01446 [Cercospora berteroae]